MWVRRKCLSKTATFSQVLGLNAEAQGPSYKCLGQLDHWQGCDLQCWLWTLAQAGSCRSHQSASPALPQEKKSLGEEWWGRQGRLLSHTVTFLKMWPLSPIPNPNSDKKTWANHEIKPDSSYVYKERMFEGDSIETKLHIIEIESLS